MIHLRPAESDDDKFYMFTLRIDPVASRMSRRRAPTWEEHCHWWERTTDRLYVAMLDDARVGTLRLSSDGVVSIIVDPAYRGMGYGPAMLKALEPLAATDGFTTLLAEVAYENVRSQQCFIKAAWMPVLFEVHL